jgi:hypothetical protein
MSRAQFSLETLFIIAISTAFLIPVTIVFFDFLRSSSDQIIQSQVNRMGETFVDTATTVYNYNDGAMIIIDITMPDKIMNLNVSNNDTLEAKVGSPKGDTYLMYQFGFNVSAYFIEDDWSPGVKTFEFNCTNRGDNVSIRRIYRQ